MEAPEIEHLLVPHVDAADDEQPRPACMTLR